MVELKLKNSKTDKLKNDLGELKTALDNTLKALVPVIETAAAGNELNLEKEVGEPNQLKAFLEALEPLLKKRKPKPCKAVKEQINQFSWVDDFSGLLSDLNKHISKYKFKDAQKIFEELTKSLSS